MNRRGERRTLLVLVSLEGNLLSEVLCFLGADSIVSLSRSLEEGFELLTLQTLCWKGMGVTERRETPTKRCECGRGSEMLGSEAAGRACRHEGGRIEWGEGFDRGLLDGRRRDGNVGNR